MAVISITIPDEIAQRVIGAFCDKYGYKDQIPDPNNPGQWIPNPVTKAQFAKDCLKQFVKAVVMSYESTKAAEDARLVASNSVNNDIIIGD